MFLRRCPLVPALLAIIAIQNTVALALPTLPNINTNNVVNVTDYGGVGDGVTTNTTAIQNAINAAAAGGNTNGLLGGTVRIPAGIFLSGPLTLKNNVNLQMDSGAVLRELPFGSYPGYPYTSSVANFISASSLTNLEISGSGAIDGQGLPWWQASNTNSSLNRPTTLSLSSSSRLLLENFTCSNPPAAHIAIKGNNAGNVTFLGITLRAPASSDPTNPSHNTDGVDFAETNAVFQDCVIDTGDDNIALGSSAGLVKDVLVTNCTFLAGHGCSIGSFTSSGVSNLTVINCTFNGTDNGIRLKSERDRGGLVQNLNYLNLTMTNVSWPFLIYSYYEFGLGTISSATPAYAANVAATDTVTQVTSTTPIWRNITFSNITAYANNTRPAFMIWGLPQMNVSNVVFQNVTLSCNKVADIYNARGIQFIDSRLNYPAATNTFGLYNAEVIVTNSAPTNTLFVFDGITTNGYANAASLYNATACMKNTNALDGAPLTLCSSTLTVSNHFNVAATTPIQFILGTNASTIVVRSNLVLNGTIDIATNGTSFGPGSYTIFTYGNSFSGTPQLGTTPATGHAYLYSLSTGTPKQVNFLVATPPPPVFNGIQVVNGTNIVASGTGGTTNFNFYVLATTNLALPVTNWSRISTNSFFADGTFGVTNSLSGAAQKFFLLQYP
jgi:polygalacturonase